MSGDPTVVRTFATEGEAELARAALESNGIPALVQGGSAAGLLRFVNGVAVVVRADDVEAARELLDSPGGGFPEVPVA